MKKILSLFLLLGLILGGIFIYPKAKLYFIGEKLAKLSKTTSFYVKSNATIDSVINQLYKTKIIADKEEFKTYATARNLKNTTLEPGKYIFKKGYKLKDIVTNLRVGYGEKEVNVTFTNARTLENICEKIAVNLEFSKADLLAKLNRREVQQKYGFNEHTIRTLFIPNTYRMYWDIKVDDFINRMRKEYKAFWNADRKNKAKNIGLSQSEVSILASIVYSETNKIEDAPKIAGVYMNRIKLGMPLQADPTLIFAIGDFSIKRVLNKDKKIDSPYNTYKNTGLPPGPIYVSPISYIDAVLNYDKHNYLYFCAKPDFSGYSNFAKTLSQHNINARKYQAALNKQKTYR